MRAARRRPGPAAGVGRAQARTAVSSSEISSRMSSAWPMYAARGTAAHTMASRWYPRACSGIPPHETDTGRKCRKTEPHGAAAGNGAAGYAWLRPRMGSAPCAGPRKPSPGGRPEGEAAARQRCARHWSATCCSPVDAAV
jgi:hypothetical protein